MSDTEANTASSNAAKRLARLVAVQALYQASFGEETTAVIVKRCLEEAHAGLNAEDSPDAEITDTPDPELLNAIVFGVMANRESLDEMLAGAMEQRGSSGRMEILLRSIFLAATFELHHHGDVAAGIIINDYVDVTRAFFNSKEPALVNAILDRLAKSLRS